MKIEGALRGTTDSFDYHAFEKEYQELDYDGNGLISKDELFRYLCEKPTTKQVNFSDETNDVKEKEDRRALAKRWGRKIPNFIK